MKGLVSLFIGLFGTFAFSWLGLTLIPNFQIGHLDPQADEEGTDIYPMPQSGMAERGRRVYVANGCFYCHSEQLRPDYIASDLDRKRDLDPHPKWGERRSAPRDYIFARPALLGKTRMGPDLANIGKAAPAEEESSAPATSGSPAASPAQAPSASLAPSAAAASPTPSASASPVAETEPGEPRPYSAAWHHRHLYSPRDVNRDSDMPAYRFLYEKRPVAGEHFADALQLTGSDAPAPGWEIVPSYDANCLVAYLMSLDQSHPLKEVKSGAPAPAAGGSPTASPAAAKGTK
ncbi:MAG TPA: cbb3-type cytochrome c oxidase subunit II [Chthoniobacterales bacterium]|nr:cbb3-type cytochrome c oxidase subunit II [Chthoniobacterales bacterium]